MPAKPPEPPAGERPTVFISYSHIDEEWKDRVVKHLRVLEPDGILEVWDDRRISGGDDWEAKIQEAMDRAAVAVLLISKDSLTSSFILETEVPYLLERRRTDGLRIIPVIVHPCAWSAVSWIEAIQCRPKDGKPLSKKRKTGVDEDLTALVLEIRSLLKLDAKGSSSPKVPKPSPSISLSRLPPSSSLFVGRETERAHLDDAWEDPKTNLFSLVAFGGVGKSSLVNAWLEDLRAEDWRGAERVFGWSFYSQGTDATGATGETFVNEALWWFGYRGEAISSSWEKGVVLARHIRERRTLLILDGLEPLQHPPGAQTGQIKDPTVRALVRELAIQNHGLCVITTRLAVADVAGKTGAVSQDLEKLPSEAGSELLRGLGVKGSDSELRRASDEFGGHALALTLLGTYLRDVCEGDVRRRREVPLLEDDDEHGHAKRVIAQYAGWLQEPEIQALRILGLFDRPAQPDTVKALRAEPMIPDLTNAIGPSHEARWRKALARLRESRLLLEGQENGALDAHPLVRAYFQEDLEKHHPEAWQEGNLRLYEYLKSSAPDLPETLETMEPLFAAVVHGCKAGRQQEVFRKVYRRRIQREKAFNWSKFGAFGLNLTALSGFFDRPWDQPCAQITPAEQAFVLNEAGLSLRALGRLAEAVQPMEAALKAVNDHEDWRSAATGASNLSELTLTLGEVSRAVAFGEQSVELADRSGDAFERMVDQTILADALHQAGRWEESAEAFREAEEMQTERQPEYPRLYSLQGCRYCDLLLSRAEPEGGAGLPGLAAAPEQAQRSREACREVQERTGEILRVARESGHSLLTFALVDLILGRTHLGLALTAPQPEAPGEEAEAELAQSAKHLDLAVAGLRRAGTEHRLPWSLLVRAAFRRLQGDRAGAKTDLTEALEIAERGSMRLFACDAHIEWARLCLQQEDAEAARRHVALARRLVEETGYGRREREVRWLEGRIANEVAPPPGHQCPG